MQTTVELNVPRPQRSLNESNCSKFEADVCVIRRRIWIAPAHDRKGALYQGSTGVNLTGENLTS